MFIIINILSVISYYLTTFQSFVFVELLKLLQVVFLFILILFNDHLVIHFAPISPIDCVLFVLVVITSESGIESSMTYLLGSLF